MRITAGKYKAKRVNTVKSQDVRPTSSKVRESIFNILQNRVSGSLMLDLFAGSGIMGLEALSRGAEEVVFVEKNPKVMRLLKENIANFDANAKVIFNDALKALDILKGSSFDIIFVDPPYAAGIYAEVLKKVKDNNLLLPDGVLILEHASSDDYQEFINDNGFEILKSKIYGDTALTFICKANGCI